MCVERERERERYYKKLVHMMMEAENSQDLQLLSWRPKRASDIIPVQVQRSKNQESWRCKFQSKSESKGKKRLMSKLKDRQSERMILFYPFILFLPSKDWIILNCIGEVSGRSICFNQSIHEHAHLCWQYPHGSTQK